MSKPIRGTCWSVTINNPTEADDEEIALARQKGWQVQGQLEQGTEGTPHYQLMVKTPQQRFSALKKAFSRAHIELATNPIALAKYVKKEDTRVGSLPVGQDQYPSLSKLWELFYEWLSEEHFIGDGYIRQFNVDTGDHDIDICEHDYSLSLFDRFIRAKILDGYMVESMGANPQIRSAFKHYWFQIVMRTRKIVNARQHPVTDRQTDIALEAATEVSLPEYKDANHQEEVCFEDQTIPS